MHFLTKLLLFKSRLLEIHEELEKSISATCGLLNTLLKAPSSDPLNKICTLIHSFTVDLACHIEGISDHDGLLQVIHPAQEKVSQVYLYDHSKFLIF